MLRLSVSYKTLLRIAGLLLLLYGRPRLAYWSLQLALWLVSMSFWSSLAMAFNQNGIEIPGSFTPFFWITLVCSLILLAAYKPVLAVLKKLCTLPTTTSHPEMDVLSDARTKE